MEPGQIVEGCTLWEPNRRINVNEIELELAHEVRLRVVHEGGETGLLVAISCQAREYHLVEVVLVFAVLQRVITHTS